MLARSRISSQGAGTPIRSCQARTASATQGSCNALAFFLFRGVQVLPRRDRVLRLRPTTVHAEVVDHQIPVLAVRCTGSRAYSPGASGAFGSDAQPALRQRLRRGAQYGRRTDRAAIHIGELRAASPYGRRHPPSPAAKPTPWAYPAPNRRCSPCDRWCGRRRSANPSAVVSSSAAPSMAVPMSGGMMDRHQHLPAVDGIQRPRHIPVGNAKARRDDQLALLHAVAAGTRGRRGHRRIGRRGCRIGRLRQQRRRAAHRRAD